MSADPQPPADRPAPEPAAPEPAAPEPAVPEPAAPGPAAADWVAGTAAALGAGLGAAVDAGRFPGGVLVVGHAGAGRAVVGRGLVAPECGDVRPDEHTRYDLASLTKVLATWPLVGAAVRAGLLDPDAPLRAALPRLPSPGGDLTVRQLMTHTSGLLPQTGLARYQHTGRPLIEHLCAEPLVSPPGAHHRYIDRGFILLGLLLPELLGRPLPVLADELWRGLGLTATAYGPLPRDVRLAPTEQRLRGAPRTWGIPHDPSAALLGGVAGHAGVFSSAADLAAFAEHLLGPAEQDGPPSTSEPSWLPGWFASSRRPLIAVEPGLSRGLAWLVAERGPVAYHHGFTGTSLYLAPDTRRFVVLCTNAVYHGWDRTRLADLRAAALHALLPDGR
ncbi:serine hydrolase domain-containing protein [Kitasatospora cineracea]|uniref:CubicO group peptidase (Beta-lactamase class C family) n=1 Tax=Kitasatospora cineracea TaxID=88074 RepID=A0A3N4RNR3_9ACTN|nr:serine hydrolase domain-containing protein [Kitasatospora cineracea]RPE35058.1 CubicO group peptidase (beta-lactamase class C family) [Kitasatospora cineracea]